MSASPPKDVEVEPGAQSPEEEQMEHQDTQAPGIGFELEVKEQDRWLPIANGWCLFQYARAFLSLLAHSICRLTVAMTGIASNSQLSHTRALLSICPSIKL